MNGVTFMMPGTKFFENVLAYLLGLRVNRVFLSVISTVYQP